MERQQDNEKMYTGHKQDHHHYHLHLQDVLLARVFSALSRQTSMLANQLVRSSSLHPVYAQSYCLKVFVEQSILVFLRVGVHPYFPISDQHLFIVLYICQNGKQAVVELLFCRLLLQGYIQSSI